jgi:hypothetical protein
MTQYFSTIVPSASAVAAINGTTQQVAALSLAAGDWTVDGELWLAATGAPSVTSAIASLSQTPAGAVGNDPKDDMSASLTEPGTAKQVGTAYGWIMPLAPMRISAAGATTVYLNCQANWTGTGGLSMYGKIAARGVAASALQASGGFVYLHRVASPENPPEEGYMNVALAQFLEPNADGGTRIRLGDRTINVVEAAADILAAMT